MRTSYFFLIVISDMIKNDYINILSHMMILKKLCNNLIYAVLEFMMVNVDKYKNLRVNVCGEIPIFLWWI